MPRLEPMPLFHLQVTTTVTTEGGGIAGGSGASGTLPSTSTGVFFHNLTNLRPTMTPIKVRSSSARGQGDGLVAGIAGLGWGGRGFNSC